jgi:stage II sporulation protein D
MMNEPTISVGILSGKAISFDLLGSYTYRRNESEMPLGGQFTATRAGDKIVIEKEGDSFTSEGDLVLTPGDFDKSKFIMHDVIIGVNFHWERKEDQQFVGSLKIIKENDMLTAVNILPVEHYLLSVISSEMSAMSNMNLLKAHAVISRGWLLAQIRKSEKLKTAGASYSSFVENDDELIRWYDREDHTLYDVCADDHCQRYQGVTKAYTQNAKQATQETRGTVLFYNGEICDARYSKSCGGKSENFENVWEPVVHPYLTSVVDNPEEPPEYDPDMTKEVNSDKWIRTSPAAFCNTSDREILSQVLLDFDQETVDFYRWKVVYTQEEISKLIREKSGTDYGEILDLVPVERGLSGRMIKLKIIGTKRTRTIGKDLEIRRTLSSSHLYSSAFVVDKKNIVDGIPQEFILTGAGWGHGVGLCQIGAAVMGAKGYSFEDILRHYFRGAELGKIY